MLRSDQLNELATALSKAQAEFTAIPKDSTNPFFKSKYAGLPKVVEVASPILTKHGLSVSQHLGHDESGDTLTTLLLHASGQFLGDEMALHLVKDDPQAHGSAVTYGRRYGYMAILGLVADEDDDAQRAVKPRAARPASGPSPKPGLPDDTLQTLSKAIRDAGMPNGWLRLQLIGAGAEDVPEQVTPATLRALTPEQARQIESVCRQAVEDRVAA